MIYFLDDTFLGITNYSCAKSPLFPVLEAIKFAIVVVQIAVPFALIIWGSLDWFKALIAHDEKEMRMKRKPFIARLVAALIVLCLPWLVQLISKSVAGKTNTVNFFTCYHEAKPRVDFRNLQLRGSSDDEDDSITTPSTPTKMKCSDFTTESTCVNGKSTTHTCKWVKEQVTYNTYNEHCVNDEKTKLTCKEYGLNNGKTCPVVDDYDTPCETIKPANSSAKPGCDYKINPKKCEDYGKNISKSACLGTDDYGKTCTWKTTNGTTGDCVTK